MHISKNILNPIKRLSNNAVQLVKGVLKNCQTGLNNTNLEDFIYGIKVFVFRLLNFKFNFFDVNEFSPDSIFAIVDFDVYPIAIARSCCDIFSSNLFFFMFVPIPILASVRLSYSIPD